MGRDRAAGGECAGRRSDCRLAVDLPDASAARPFPPGRCRLLALALILPVLLAVGRRARAGPAARPADLAMGGVGAGGALPFVLSALIVRAGEAVGAIGGARRFPLGSEVITLHSRRARADRRARLR